ncbi:hypothetical protein BJY04DRAFT_217850 [Aspergillus karnatakaensis]|uniref:uncharacterized protein n=1 Tax=Aspergillus karnatakaensis TaxID=1810916 RepID=UPI003CCCE3AA
MVIPKWTNEVPRTLEVGEGTIDTPHNTGVSPSVLPFHTHPDIWEDPPAWKLLRWVSAPAERAIADEVFHMPSRSTYISWSDGPLSLLGSELSQVETVAVLVSLLRDHQISALPEPEERQFEDTKRRTIVTIDDVDMQTFLIYDAHTASLLSYV